MHEIYGPLKLVLIIGGGGAIITEISIQISASQVYNECIMRKQYVTQIRIVVWAVQLLNLMNRVFNRLHLLEGLAPNSSTLKHSIVALLMDPTMSTITLITCNYNEYHYINYM